MIPQRDEEQRPRKSQLFFVQLLEIFTEIFRTYLLLDGIPFRFGKSSIETVLQCKLKRADFHRHSPRCLLDERSRQDGTLSARN